MISFNFSTEVTSRVIEELRKAKKYIKIAVFQLHNPEVFKVVEEKLKQGILVEIFTLPYDSINSDIRNEVQRRFESIGKNGAKLYFCKWNIGNPENTRTVVARWYSFHGKFLVTENVAIALSANFTMESELDAIITFNDASKIKEYNNKFDELKKLFINNEIKGRIKESIKEGSKLKETFSLPPNIDEVHRDYWINDYPSQICSEDTKISDRLFIAPFDCKGRNFIEKFTGGAEKFIYIATESFTDNAFPNNLSKIAQEKHLEIKVITGAKSRDFTDRIQNNFREMLAANIKIRNFREETHAKIVISDKGVMVGSMNLNMINLGFSKKEGLWRENTETFAVCTERDVIKEAKKQYEDIFNNYCNDVEEVLIEKLQKNISKELGALFNLKADKQVRLLFAKSILVREIETKRFVISVGEAMQKLVKMLDKKKADSEIFFSALVLYHLSERKMERSELRSNLREIDDKTFDLILNKLESMQLINKVGIFYKKNLV